MKPRPAASLLSLLVLFCPPLGARPPAPPAKTGYFPLVVGNTWTYRVGENRFALKVAGFDKVGDLRCARLETIVNNKSVAQEHVAVTAKGVVRTKFDGKDAKPPILFLELPAKKDATWNVESKIDGQALKGTFVEGEEEKVEVPAGAFKTVTVRSKGLEVNGVKVELTYYFADKVGMVKQVVEYAGQKAVIELEKFEPGKE
jgi:hypothetical protein